MGSNTQSLNQEYVDQLYNRYLSKSFGINSCTTQFDMVLLDGQKILLDRANYMDISSPNNQDQIFMLNPNQPTWAEYISSLPNTQENLFNKSTLYSVPTAPKNNSIVSNIFPPIEVVVGSSQATILNILPDTTTISNNSFFNQYVEIFRNNINLPSIDPGSGDGYFTKDFSSYTINLSSPLRIGEIIKIKIIT